MAGSKSTLQELRRLTEQFRALGVLAPEFQAKSQLEEGIPEYSRMVFLQQAWKSIVAEDETS